MRDVVTSVVIAGLGGQGVIKCSDILAEAAMRSGYDVKKAEIHGMSQRGGSVTTDVRFGPKVLSPMISRGEADVLVVLREDQIENNRHLLKAGGRLLVADEAVLTQLSSKLSNKKLLNTALLGRLSRELEIPEEHWLAAIRGAFPAELHQPNIEAFEQGKTLNVD